jgi:hypothetical protein
MNYRKQRSDRYIEMYRDEEGGEEEKRGRN